MAGGGDFIDRISLITGTAGVCGVTGSGAGCGSDDSGINGSVWISYRVLKFFKATLGTSVKITAVRAARTSNCFNKYIGMIQRSISE